VRRPVDRMSSEARCGVLVIETKGMAEVRALLSDPRTHGGSLGSVFEKGRSTEPGGREG
jgi:hypothetical protein